MTVTSIDARDLVAAVFAHEGSTAAAIIHNGRTLPYADLLRRVRALAAALGPRPGTVGVHVGRNPETVVALLGILAAGGAYVPVDPAFPAERRAAMLAAAGCTTVLSTADGQPDVPGARLLDVRTTAGDGDDEPLAAAAPDDTAYVLFTSGSTGAPKPVATPRQAISTVAAALERLFALSPADRVLQFASLNWDTCFEEILPTLAAGAALVIDDEAHTGSFPRLLRMLDRRGVTVVDLPTAYWHELVRYLAEDGERLPGSLRLVVIGGEAASPARLADWHALDTEGVRLLNTYGCTETTLITHAAGLDVPAEGGRVPIGRALPHVVERVGEDGELLVGGPSLAAGYLGLPEETAARFVHTPHGRFFRTGDRVERTEDGHLLHLGRLDGEVKVRGVRVAPGEVEALLGAHPRVAETAVVGVTAAGRTVLVAYAVLGEDVRAADVLAWLRQRAPAHLVPARVVAVPELAYTASGKVDRAATHRRYGTDKTGRRDG